MKHEQLMQLVATEDWAYETLISREGSITSETEASILGIVFNPGIAKQIMLNSHSMNNLGEIIANSKSIETIIGNYGSLSIYGKHIALNTFERFAINISIAGEIGHANGRTLEIIDGIVPILELEAENDLRQMEIPGSQNLPEQTYILQAPFFKLSRAAFHISEELSMKILDMFEKGELPESSHELIDYMLKSEAENLKTQKEKGIPDDHLAFLSQFPKVIERLKSIMERYSTREEPEFDSIMFHSDLEKIVSEWEKNKNSDEYDGVKAYGLAFELCGVYDKLFSGGYGNRQKAADSKRADEIRKSLENMKIGDISHYSNSSTNEISINASLVERGMLERMSNMAEEVLAMCWQNQMLWDYGELGPNHNPKEDIKFIYTNLHTICGICSFSDFLFLDVDKSGALKFLEDVGILDKENEQDYSPPYFQKKLKSLLKALPNKEIEKILVNSEVSDKVKEYMLKQDIFSKETPNLDTLLKISGNSQDLQKFVLVKLGFHVCKGEENGPQETNGKIFSAAQNVLDTTDDAEVIEQCTALMEKIDKKKASQVLDSKLSQNIEGKGKIRIFTNRKKNGQNGDAETRVPKPIGFDKNRKPPNGMPGMN